MKDILKKRSLNLAQPLTVQQENSLTQKFSQLPGVRGFEAKNASDLKITYGHLDKLKLTAVNNHKQMW